MSDELLTWKETAFYWDQIAKQRELTSYERALQAKAYENMNAAAAQSRARSEVLQHNERDSKPFTIKPMPGKVAVEVLGDTEKVGEFGILWAPDSSKIPRTTGRVIAVYEPFTLGDAPESSPFVDVDDIIVFGQWSGTKITVGRKDYLIIREHDILCIIEGADESTIQATEAALDAGDTD